MCYLSSLGVDAGFAILFLRVAETSQFKPLPENEKMICLRFSSMRRLETLSQFELAETLGVTRNQIANVESMRVPLRAALAVDFCLALGVNPQWLATGNGAPKHSKDVLKSFIRVCPHPDGLFSDVFFGFLAARIPPPVEVRDYIDEAISRVADFLKRTQGVKGGAALQEDRRMAQEEYGQIESLLAKAREEMVLRRDLKDIVAKNDLTEAANENRSAEVKLLLPNLRERLNKVTSAPGKKSELAKFLGAPLASVSRWLSGDREPGGEITLKMLHWVELQERK